MSEPTKEQLVEQVIADLLSPMTVSEGRWQQAQALRALLRERGEKSEHTAAVNETLARLRDNWNAAAVRLTEAQRKIERLGMAVGLATTAVPSMEMDSRHPVEMMQRVCARVRDLEAQLADEQEQHRRATIRDEAQLQAEREYIEFLQGSLERVAKATGIQEPIQLIAKAENNTQTYTDILVKHVEEKMGQLAAEVEKRERLRERVSSHIQNASSPALAATRVGMGWVRSMLEALLTEADKGEGSEPPCRDVGSRTCCRCHERHDEGMCCEHAREGTTDGR